MSAETLRIATYNADLSRKGPGLLLRDILRANDPQIQAVAQVVADVAPDILVLQGVDYDLGQAALTGLRDAIARGGGPDYPYTFALRPNSGMATGLDMDGDGRRGGARDKQGYGQFAGDGGMAILSRFPIDRDGVRDFSDLLWKDMPGAIMPVVDGKPFPSVEAQDVQRLSSVGHWVVPVTLGATTLTLLAFHATPPVFDGPEDRNGRRNHDELTFWRIFLDGQFGTAPGKEFVVIGDANLDPVDGDGRKAAILTLLGDKRLQDPRPMRPGPVRQGAGHKGDARLDTVAWPGPVPGHMRVDYVLPSVDLTVVGAGVYWPPEGTEGAVVAEAASRHRMVWVDLLFQ